jgi:hypothetical protein
MLVTHLIDFRVGILVHYHIKLFEIIKVIAAATAQANVFIAD